MSSEDGKLAYFSTDIPSAKTLGGVGVGWIEEARVCEYIIACTQVKSMDLGAYREPGIGTNLLMIILGCVGGADLLITHVEVDIGFKAAREAYGFLGHGKGSPQGQNEGRNEGLS